MIPRVGEKVLTPDDGEGTVEEVLKPGTLEYCPPYYRDNDTEVHNVPLLRVRTRTHRWRHYFVDELVEQQGRFL